MWGVVSLMQEQYIRWCGVLAFDTGVMHQMMWGFVCWIPEQCIRWCGCCCFLVGYRSNVSDDVGFCLLDTGAMYQMMWGFVCWIQVQCIRWCGVLFVGYRCNVSDDVGFCLLDTEAMGFCLLDTEAMGFCLLDTRAIQSQNMQILHSLGRVAVPASLYWTDGVNDCFINGKLWVSNLFTIFINLTIIITLNLPNQNQLLWGRGWGRAWWHKRTQTVNCLFCVCMLCAVQLSATPGAFTDFLPENLRVSITKCKYQYPLFRSEILLFSSQHRLENTSVHYRRCAQN